ncbi:sel1 repeat family protein [Salinivibrio proteolyticus]|uniref:Sel1 repeat family protein n=1 Tax=Salinivibrio proteolyticus TaxID=334715 RepID=A0ABY7LLV5_9GAMM|nr:sel1 repeat family protein [Salinivibrio proteolyticus]WBA16613.1 sel1 repeat family protein [Salinivibrio proteolyticus]
MSVYKNIRKIAFLLFVVIAISACKEKEKAINPEDDIPLFKDFIERNIDKVADDPYISSTVRPESEMYDVLLDLQRGTPWSKEEENRFNRLIEKGNAHATILLSRLRMNDISKKSIAVSRLAKLMSDGNPYAAYWLSNRSYRCRAHLGSSSLGNKVAKDLGLDTSYENKYCTEEIYQKAVEGFKKLAAQGDLRAQYFLLKDQGLDKSVEKREEYIKEVIRFAEAHYYKPLMDYIDSLQKQTNDGVVFRSENLEKIAFDLLKVASNNNYIPAMGTVMYYEENNDELFERMKKVGGSYYFLSMALDRSDELNKQEKYCHALLYEKIFKDSRYFIYYDDWPDKNDYDESICEIDKEIAEMKPMIYIDYFTRIANWGRG